MKGRRRQRPGTVWWGISVLVVVSMLGSLALFVSPPSPSSTPTVTLPTPQPWPSATATQAGSGG